MIHISRTKKKQYIVAVVSDKNGKVIMTSEPLKTLGSAKKNILALLGEYDKKSIVVQHNTNKKPSLKEHLSDGTVITRTWIPRKPYQPK